MKMQVVILEGVILIKLMWHFFSMWKESENSTDTQSALKYFPNPKLLQTLDLTPLKGSCALFFQLKRDTIIRVHDARSKVFVKLSRPTR